jgi:hypothetical protein
MYLWTPEVFFIRNSRKRLFSQIETTKSVIFGEIIKTKKLSKSKNLPICDLRNLFDFCCNFALHFVLFFLRQNIHLLPNNYNTALHALFAQCPNMQIKSEEFSAVGHLRSWVLLRRCPNPEGGR